MSEALGTEAQALFTALRQAADSAIVAEIEQLVATGEDRALCRINVIDFAGRRGLDVEPTIAAFLHAARLGIFVLSWNMLCRSCGGVIESGTTLKAIDQPEYICAFCAAGFEPVLDDLVEVTFTVTRRIRRIAAHEPNELPIWDYYQQIFWSPGIDLPEDFAPVAEELTLDAIELSPGEKAVLSMQLPAGLAIVFDPVSHTALFLDVAGEPTRERQNLSLILSGVQVPTVKTKARPGPLRLSLENRCDQRVLPTVWIADDRLEHLLCQRKPYLTAKRLLTNQTFRELYGNDTIDADQRLKITSMTFLFTDLRGSTELYDRIGDLAAFELVRAHFHVLQEIVAAEAGAVVKTIGDAVMATFPTPDRAVSAALRMRQAMQQIRDERHDEDLLLKIGIHEGPCLAVMLNDRQDYFGQTVNIASRVQGLADSHTIFATGPVVDHPISASLLAENKLMPMPQQRVLRGIPGAVSVYEIP